MILKKKQNKDTRKKEEKKLRKGLENFSAETCSNRLRRFFAK